MDLDVPTLRELFRNLQAFRALYESEGVSIIVSHDGTREYCLWDIEYLYSQIWRLAKRQREAIELCFVQGQREVDAAVLMGVSPTNPVSMYANDGLKRLLVLLERGELDRYRTKEAIA